MDQYRISFYKVRIKPLILYIDTYVRYLFLHDILYDIMLVPNSEYYIIRCIVNSTKKIRYLQNPLIDNYMRSCSRDFSVNWNAYQSRDRIQACGGGQDLGLFRVLGRHNHVRVFCVSTGWRNTKYITCYYSELYHKHTPGQTIISGLKVVICQSQASSKAPDNTHMQYDVICSSNKEFYLGCTGGSGRREPHV